MRDFARLCPEGNPAPPLGGYGNAVGELPGYTHDRFFPFPSFA